ncbi:MAG: serpin family protein, partial [Clostridia bacterium]|nr:serpin family protein [Clostridia bacterium]
DTDGLCVTSAKHAARVKTDEEGIEAAAYTVMLVAESAMMPDPETVYFTLDRPFAFVVTGMTDAPMFFGIVNDVEQ